jgi:cardiolipin synthase (CMP-forming)
MARGRGLARRRMKTSTESLPAEVVTSRVLTIPNVLSLARIATVPVFVWLFVNDHTNAAVTLYAIAAWTDFFDGYLARRLDSVSELGKLLDPLADRVFIVALAVALVGRDVLPLWLAITVIARDVVILSAFPFVDRSGIKRIPVSFTGKTATAALLAGLTLLAASETTVPVFGNDTSATVGMILTVTGALLYWVAGVMYAGELVRRLRTVRDSG